MNKQLLQKYLDGHCSPEEQDLVNKYLAEDSTDPSVLKELLQSSWANSSGEAVDEATTLRLLSRIKETVYPQKGKTPVISIHKYKKQIIRYTAAACIAALLITAAMLPGKDLFTGKSKPDIAAVEWKTIRNTSTATRTAWLPDSSRIWLTPNSTLSYAAGFKDRRSVRLEGEAFFDVTHDPLHPFIVYSGDISTRVLGTAFNIESYCREKLIRVSLVRGSVAVQDITKTKAALPAISLQAGQVLTYDRSTHAASKEELKRADINEWTNGYMVLNDVLITDAIARIAGRYNMNVLYEKNVHLDNKRVSTVFKNQTPDEMLNLLLFVHQYKYRKKGNVLEIINPL
jgi:ferric-dicitrate binding protein FerR (iron transport regulator)